MKNSELQMRKVLFVASGNKAVGQVNSFVRSQYESLEKEGLEMRLFPVVGHGAKGYAKAIFALRKVVRQERPDIIHAHYSVCGHVAWLACLGLQHKPKIVVSILGSFPTRNRKWKLVRYCVQHLWDATIVKSNRTATQLDLPVNIIPNGVNLETFQVMDHEEARKLVGFESTKTQINTVPAINIDKDYINKKEESSDIENISTVTDPQSACIQASRQSDDPSRSTDTNAQCLSDDSFRKNVDSINCEKSEKKYVIWCSNPERKEKNWPLAVEGVNALKDEGINVELVPVYDKTPNEVMTYMNAADCLLLTSDSEGSPNVIKEAMACNCPIVTTNVGDVTERLKDLDGCYVVEDNDCRFIDMPKAAALTSEAIAQALEFGKRTEGRERLLKDKLEISQIAKRIIEVYEQV